MLKFYFDSNNLLVKTKQNILTINTFGINETELSNKIEIIVNKYKNQIYISFLPSYEGVQLRIKILENSNINITLLKREIIN